MYTSSGHPTAAIVETSATVIDHKLFWIPCETLEEAHYLLAVINSDVLRDMVAPLMSQGQFGPRDLHKHLWKLPIPKFDSDDPKHIAVSKAGKQAQKIAATKRLEVEAEYANPTYTRIRREVRSWLATSPTGKAVETAVSNLITTAHV